ncbi:alpha/beta fold hydrolase [Nocardioides sp. cx-169]|uniref:alpha/beta fold hydrolase n=1 Tax=Nocardioides sp. cx-169 TaxID=2899080 RepID=UPI001E2E46E1|nr:alpha/beta fold hydrolase [Nocardioides sp. cx-169]MCD4533851.1 alpha/beta fold hydrolase [Nocardioides sp. cx-169]
MDLIPRPGQVVAAAGNVARVVLRGGVADLRGTPRTLIDEGPLRQLYHYRPETTVVEHGDPVLLVTPPGAPGLCYDLRRGCSLAERLVSGGHPTYQVEYGEVRFEDRDLDLDPWVSDVLPAAVREVSAHAGGRPVHLVGWSLGGILALLTAADGPELPLASLAVLGAAVDLDQVPLVAPARPLLDPTQGSGLTARGAQVLASLPLVRWASGHTAVQRLLAKPVAVGTRLDDTEFLAQVEAVDRFTAGMRAYSGRAYGQLFHRFIRGNALASGSIELGERTISLAGVDRPVLVFAGATDGIAPLPAVRAVEPLLESSPEVRFEIAPGGHLGMLTGREARSGTWPTLDDWLTQWSSELPPTVPAEAATIGTRRRRRHGSQSSRALST